MHVWVFIELNAQNEAAQRISKHEAKQESCTKHQLCKCPPRETSRRKRVSTLLPQSRMEKAPPCQALDSGRPLSGNGSHAQPGRQKLESNQHRSSTHASLVPSSSKTQIPELCACGLSKLLNHDWKQYAPTLSNLLLPPKSMPVLTVKNMNQQKGARARSSCANMGVDQYSLGPPAYHQG